MPTGEIASYAATTFGLWYEAGTHMKYGPGGQVSRLSDNTIPASVACTAPSQPLLTLRGHCEESGIDQIYTPLNIKDSLDSTFDWNNHEWPGLVYVGQKATKIFYNLSESGPGRYGTWTLSGTHTGYGYSWDTHATSDLRGKYGRGKNTWNMSAVFYCPRWQMTKMEGDVWHGMVSLKLSGCFEGQFTCDDGQCIEMTQRCDQLVHCRDKSDEENCQLVWFTPDYKMLVPPVTTISSTNFTIVPVPVNISLVLMKVVEIEERDHSIHLQFQIILEWRENRVTYHNLKMDTALNALRDEELQRLWLPLVIFENTDQKESTRLGAAWEWTTRVTVTREGNFVRSQLEEVDEIEIFAGKENKLTMNQTYTHEFQCTYKMSWYPFDTQASTNIAQPV